MLGKTFGSYHVLNKLGGGPLTKWYEAENWISHEHIWLKILRPKFAGKAEIAGKYVEAARAASNIKSEHVLEIFEVSKDTAPFFAAVKPVNCWTLAAELKDHPDMSLSSAVDTIIRITRGVAVIHEYGLVHGHLCPANIMCSPGGILKVTDTGLSALTVMPDNFLKIMRPDDLIFAAPEQLVGELTPQTDVYALGAMLYFFITGEPVFSGESAEEVMNKHVSSSIPKLSECDPPIPDMLRAVISRCLEKNPEDRFNSAGNLTETLSWWLSSHGEPVPARTEMPVILTRGPVVESKHEAAASSQKSVSDDNPPVVSGKVGDPESASTENEQFIGDPADEYEKSPVYLQVIGWIVAAFMILYVIFGLLWDKIH